MNVLREWNDILSQSSEYLLSLRPATTLRVLVLGQTPSKIIPPSYFLPTLLTAPQVEYPSPTPTDWYPTSFLGYTCSLSGRGLSSFHFSFLLLFSSMLLSDLGFAMSQVNPKPSGKAP